MNTYKHTKKKKKKKKKGQKVNKWKETVECNSLFNTSFCEEPWMNR